MPTVENLNVSLNMQTANFSRGVQTAVSGLGKIGLAGIGVNQILNVARSGIDAFWSRIEKADKLGEFSANIGMSAEELSKLHFAAEMADTSAEQLDTALKNLAKSHPGMTFAEAVAELESLDDEMARAKRANELFGRSWIEINALLRQGNANIEQLKNASDALGATMSNEQVERAGRLVDAWKELSAAVSGFGASIVDIIAPTVTDMFETWAKGILDIRLLIAEFMGDVQLQAKILAEIAQIGNRGGPGAGGGAGVDNPADAARRASHRSGIGAAERFTVEGFSAAQQGQRRMEDLAKQQLNAQKQMAAGINQINGNLQKAIPIPAAL